MKIFFGVLGALIAFSILRTIASNLVPQPTAEEIRMQQIKREIDNSWDAIGNSMDRMQERERQKQQNNQEQE